MRKWRGRLNQGEILIIQLNMPQVIFFRVLREEERKLKRNMKKCLVKKNVIFMIECVKDI